MIEPYPGRSAQGEITIHWVGNGSGPHDLSYDASGIPIGVPLYSFVITGEGDTTVDITYTVNFATGGTGKSVASHVVLAASADGAV
jgi:hypothetical protein